MVRFSHRSLPKISNNIIVSRMLQFHSSRPSFRFLDVDVRTLEIARAGRHTVYRVEEATVDISPLVSPHNRVVVLLVFVHRVHGISEMVRRNELLRALDNVRLLRS